MVIEGDDDVNDSTDWTTWPSRRSQTRTPRPAFDADADTSDEEDEEDKLQDPTTRSTDEEQPQRTESGTQDKRDLDIDYHISESAALPNLAIQLADEAALSTNPYPSKSKHHFMFPTDEFHPSTLHDASALDVKIDFTPTPTTATDETPMSRSINDSAVDIGSLFVPSPLQMQGQSLDKIQAQSSISPTANLGLGFPLPRFRRTFAQQRWRRDMEGLAERFGRLCVT